MRLPYFILIFLARRTNLIFSSSEKFAIWLSYCELSYQLSGLIAHQHACGELDKVLINSLQVKVYEQYLLLKEIKYIK